MTCAPAFRARRLGGFVRECHGDLHLGNIAFVDGQVTLFDRIEFNESMRWIDVMSDVDLGAIRIRTDVERKRLHGVGIAEGSDSPLGQGLYVADATRRTYTHVCEAGAPGSR